MEIEVFISKEKIFYNNILEFLEEISELDFENQFQDLIKSIESQDIFGVKYLLELIARIENNHQRNSSFYPKIEKILSYFLKDGNTHTSNTEIVKIFINNMKILYLLFEKEIVKVDEKIHSILINNLNKNKLIYLYPVIKNSFDSENQSVFEEEIKEVYQEDINEIYQKSQIGENDLYICRLIREDSVEEFITHVNSNQISLKSKIRQSIFETNHFLKGKEPTLIEYAAFFGSMQIIKYLNNSNVRLYPSLWLYAIHSNNPELIHFLEEKEVPIDKKVLEESIKCHHNDISDYIIDNVLINTRVKDENRLIESFEPCIIESKNYYFYPDKIDYIISRPTSSSNEFNISNLCPPLKSITINQPITKIGKYKFKNYSTLKQISLPSTLNEVGRQAFEGIESLQITGEIQIFPKNMFKGCSKLKEISIPSSVKEICDFAFDECPSLKKISLPSSPIKYGINIFKKFESLQIAGEIQVIQDNMFKGCSELREITIPSSVTKIGAKAFFRCTSLKEISIPSSVIDIGDSCFALCSSLVKVSFDSPYSLKNIGNYTFSRCTSLKEISIPSTVIKIGSYLMTGCTSLEQIIIPDSVKEIREYAFSGCTSLNEIQIPSSVEQFGYKIFDDIASIKLINGIKNIPEYLFYENESLEKIVIPSSVETIGDKVFYKCTKLKEVIFENPSQLTTIGDMSFNCCSSLTEITFPKTIIKIGKDCFGKCPELKEITIPTILRSMKHPPGVKIVYI